MLNVVCVYAVTVIILFFKKTRSEMDAAMWIIRESVCTNWKYWLCVCTYCVRVHACVRARVRVRAHVG